jgi:hypothetical protein
MDNDTIELIIKNLLKINAITNEQIHELKVICQAQEERIKMLESRVYL